MIKIALLQMTGGIDPDANASALVSAVSQARVEGASFLFTPELSGLVDCDVERASRSITSEERDTVLMKIRQAAAEAGIWVHLGSLTIRRPDGRLANRGFVIDAKGDIRARYDKIHLFDVDLPTGETWRESDTYTAGGDTSVVETPAGVLGMTICYDLRFPDLFSTLSNAGADILSVPAAFTRPTGSAHWHILLRARAIEAGAWVVAAGQTGLHEDGRETFGHSLVIDPWGDVLLDMGEEPGLGFATIDPQRRAEVFSRVPVLQHRRDIPEVLSR